MLLVLNWKKIWIGPLVPYSKAWKNTFTALKRLKVVVVLLCPSLDSSKTSAAHHWVIMHLGPLELYTFKIKPCLMLKILLPVLLYFTRDPLKKIFLSHGNHWGNFSADKTLLAQHDWQYQGQRELWAGFFSPFPICPIQARVGTNTHNT